MVKVFFWFCDAKSENLALTTFILDIIIFLLTSVLDLKNQTSSVMNEVILFSSLMMFFFASACLTYFIKYNMYHTTFHLSYFTIKLGIVSFFFIGIMCNMASWLIVLIPSMLVQFWWSFYFLFEIKIKSLAKNKYSPVSEKLDEPIRPKII